MVICYRKYSFPNIRECQAVAKLFIEDLAVNGKKVLMRVDFNVPLDSAQNVIDPTRIESTLPSIRYVLDQGGALILMSHLGRPRNDYSPELSLKPVAKILSALLDRPVELGANCIGEKVREQVDTLKKGSILLLENLRFHRAEEHPEEDSSFAQELASFGDCYVNDAFAASHRKHSSTYTLPSYFEGKAAAGYLLQQEIRTLGEALKTPQRPFVALIGGAKISTKIGVIKSLLKRADLLIIGGAMAYTFLKALKFEVAGSLVENSLVSLANEILDEYKEKILLPIDVIAAAECSESAKTQAVTIAEGIPDGMQGYDIGPKSVDLFGEALAQAKTILWNGPFGVYELDNFAQGTTELAKRVAQLSSIKMVGGGDLIAAIRKAGVIEQMTHVSTGGGATLEYIEFGTLPGIEALSDKTLTTKTN